MCSLRSSAQEPWKSSSCRVFPVSIRGGPRMGNSAPDLRERVIRYGVAVALAMLALVIRGLLPIEEGRVPYLVALSAIIASAWFGGRGPGLLSTAVSAAGIGYFFIPPVHSLGVAEGHRLGHVLFLVTAVVMVEFTASRRVAQRALQESEERFRLMAENLGEVFWIHSLRPEQVLYVSPSFERVWGLPPGDLLANARLWLENVHPEDRPRVAETFSSWIAENGAFDVEYRIRRSDGTERWIHDHGVLIRDERGKAYRACGIAEDITERKQMGERLRTSEELWRAAFENNPTMYFMIDGSGAVRSVNRFGAEQLGYTVDELVGRSVLDVFHPEDRAAVARNCAARIERLGETARWELRKVRKDGRVICVRESARAVRGPTGEPMILIACEDITDARQAAETLAKVQAELAHVTRVTTMGELAASIAHEINQPLAAIVANASALLRWLARDPLEMEEVRQAATRIASEGERAGAIVGRVRALSRRAPPLREPLGINDVVEEVISLIGPEAKKSGVSVESVLASELPMVLGDRVQMQQVLVNLIINAIESMSTIAEGPRTLMISSVEDEGDRVQIAVADSGAGLDPGAMQRLFEPFFSTKPRGLGMGLAISRSIVESHGGRISVAPNAPRGTVFQFTLPAAPKVAEVDPRHSR